MKYLQRILAGTKAHTTTLLSLTALVLILCLAFVLRLHKIHTPLADWHSWRQVDTASVTREYLRFEEMGYNSNGLHKIFSPRFHDLSDIPSGKVNLEGYRMVEFPIINYSVSLILELFPQYGLVPTYRFINVLLAVATIATVYGIVILISKQQRIALLSAFIMAVMPYSIFYSRTILPEIGMNFFSYFSVLCFILWLRNYRKTKNYLHPNTLIFYLLTWVSLALSFLLKPVAVFMAPVYIVLILSEFGLLGWMRQWPLFILTTSILPLLGWRTYIEQFSSGIPANSWLFNGNGIRLKPAWWRWLFGERIAFHMLGQWASGFLILGLLGINKFTSGRNTALFYRFCIALAFGWFMYLVVFATGNVQHDYYQIPLIPVVSILVASGVIWLYDTLKNQLPRIIVAVALTFILALSTFLAWYHIRGYYQINNPAIVEAGIAVDTLTPQKSLVIAPYMGDTAFLFQTNRRGWPIGFSIDEKIRLGATHYVTTTYDDEARELEARFTTLEKTPKYLLLDLTLPASESALVIKN